MGDPEHGLSGGPIHSRDRPQGAADAQGAAGNAHHQGLGEDQAHHLAAAETV